MKFFYDLERKYQRYAIKNLMYYIVILYGRAGAPYGSALFLLELSVSESDRDSSRTDLEAGDLYHLSADHGHLCI